MKTKAFGYVRVSGQGQVNGHGLERQEQEIRAFAQKIGMELVQIFREEGISGTADETKRPAFQEMIEAMLGNGVRTVIVEGLDRLARELRVQENLLVYLAAKGISLFSARTEEDVTAALQADPMKKALVQMQGVFAELDKSLLVKKLRKARDAKRAQAGKCEGRKGYDDVPESQAVIQAIKRLRRQKPGQRRMTYEEVANTLNSQGFSTLDGKPFTKGNVQQIVFRHGKSR